MSCLRYLALCMLVAFMACAVVSVPMAMAAPPAGKGNPAKGGGKNHQSSGGQDHQKGGGKGQQKGGGKDHQNGGGSDLGKSDGALTLVAAGITALAARDIARGYNLGGYQALPPGIQKNLMRGKPLPPGIAKKAVPGGMLGRLPVHPGYEWRIAGRDLILVAAATEIVADVLHDVFD